MILVNTQNLTLYAGWQLNYFLLKIAKYFQVLTN